MMQLGVLTAPFPDTPLGDVADWAASVGFETLEIACWPRTAGATRRYAGTSHIDVATLGASEAKDIAASLKSKGVGISALGYYPNPLHRDLSHRQTVIDHVKSVVNAASLMGLQVVNTFMGGDAAQTVDANWKEAEKVWPEIIKFARGKGVTLA